MQKKVSGVCDNRRLQVCFSDCMRVTVVVACPHFVQVPLFLHDVIVRILRQIAQSRGEISHPREGQEHGLDYQLPQCITFYITIQ